MHGHHHHCIISLVVLLQIGIQGDFFQEACQGRIIRILHIGINAGFQFSDVFQPGLIFLCLLGVQHIHIAAADQQLLVEIRQADPFFQQLRHTLDKCRELHQLRCRLFQRAVGIGIGNHAVQRDLRRLGQTLCGFDGLCTQASGRIVDDPLEPQIICPVIDDTQIRQHILYFGTIKETGAADNAIRNTVALKGIFQSVGLGIGAIQHRKIPEILSLGKCDYLTGNIVGLCSLVLRLVNGDGISLTVAGPELLSLSAQIVGDYRIGGIQNRLGGAVILLQTDGSASLVLLFKIQDIFDGCAPEAVNTLIVIAHNADIFISPSQQRGEQILHMVGVLILVHQNIAEFSLIVSTDIFVLLQQLYGHKDDIIKVQSIVFPEPLLILHIGSCHVLRTDIPGLFSPFQHLFSGNHVVLFPAHSPQHIAGGEGLFVQIHVPDDFLHHPFRIRRIINGKAAGVAHPLNIPAQDPAASGMEGHGPDILRFRPQQDCQALLQLIGGLVGEGDGHNAPGNCRLHGAEEICPTAFLLGRGVVQLFQEQNILLSHRVGDLPGVTAPAVAHDIGYSVDEDCGLAAACACQQKQRPLGGKNRLLLHGIQLRKAPGNVLPPGC